MEFLRSSSNDIPTQDLFHHVKTYLGKAAGSSELPKSSSIIAANSWQLFGSAREFLHTKIKV